MKRTIAWLLCAVLVLGLCACGSNVTVTGSSDAEETAEVVITELKTMGDALTAGKDSQTVATWNEEHYIYCLMFNGVPTRVMADLDAEMYQKVDEVIFSGAEDAEDQLAALLSPLPLSSVEDLSDGMLSDGELSKLAGKSGADLLADGWIINGSYWSDGEEFAVLMDQGNFCYQINFDQDVERGDDFDVETAIQDLTVASAAFYGLGDACTDVDPVE